MKELYFPAKSEILSVYEKFWGNIGIMPFLENTCNIHLEWEHESSMLYIFKWTMALFHSKQVVSGWYDTESFYSEYPRMHDFLGFSNINKEKINLMVEQYENVRNRFQQMPAGNANPI